MSDVITIGAGTAGCNVGKEIFKQFAAEHGVNKSGCQKLGNMTDCSKFFDETPNKYRIPKALFIDTDESILDCGRYKQLFETSLLSLDNLNEEMIMSKLRTITEKSDCIQGFMVPYSINSRLVIPILQHLRDDFNKTQIHSLQLYTSCKPNRNYNYNISTILSMAKSCEYEDVCLVFDNQKLRQITETYLRSYLVSMTDYNIINEYISRIISGYTSQLRYDGALNVNMKEIKTNLVPFPSLHYLISSTAPIIPKENIIQSYYVNQNERALLVNGYSKDIIGIGTGVASEINKIILERYCNYFEIFTKYMDTKLISITLYTFQPESYPINTFGNYGGKFMAVCLNYRGNIVPKDVEYVVSTIKTKRTIQFVDWCPTGFKVGMIYNKMVLRDDEDECIMDATDKQVTNIGNNTIMMDFIGSQTQFIKKDKLNSKYMSKDDETEFLEAYERITSLYNDYEECLVKQDEDEDEDEDDTDDDSY